MLTSNILDEINDLRAEPTHRAALRIYNLLEHNKDFFVKSFDDDFYNYIFRNFEALANYRAIDTTTSEFKEEYNKIYQMLSYRIDKLI
ncbi:MAG: hypothetical protein K0S32_1080 [Bacteroidetes bacterium]|jgi:hypothetical protein|nr:hypothetical protein [Bacteroidota bacterium]